MKILYITKVTKSWSIDGVSNSFKKMSINHYPEHICKREITQDSQFPSFFGRIENTINCIEIYWPLVHSSKNQKNPSLKKQYYKYMKHSDFLKYKHFDFKYRCVFHLDNCLLIKLSYPAQKISLSLKVWKTSLMSCRKISQYIWGWRALELQRSDTFRRDVGTR